jgi:hypothetical protein
MIKKKTKAIISVNKTFKTKPQALTFAKRLYEETLKWH